MGDAVAVTALGKLLMNLGTVRLAVTALALGNLAVLGMAFGTAESRMLGDIVLQQLVGLVMTASADLLGLVRGVGYLQRGMNRMAGQAVRRFELSQRAVILMTFKADRNAAVFLGMTG